MLEAGDAGSERGERQEETGGKGEREEVAASDTEQTEGEETKRVGGGWEREEERRQHAEGRQFFGFLVGFEREWKFVRHRVATAIANERPV